MKEIEFIKYIGNCLYCNIFFFLISYFLFIYLFRGVNFFFLLSIVIFFLLINNV